jgi:membrane protease YdiL (CAAX protease family)
VIKNRFLKLGWFRQLDTRDWHESKKQQIAIAALPTLVLTMLGVYQAAGRMFGSNLGWYVGFLIYWPLWCVFYPVWILGWKEVKNLFRSRKLVATDWILLFFYPMLSLIGVFLFHQEHQKLGQIILYVLMCFGNGFFEEILWRGVYIRLFAGDKLWGFVWPTLWFAIWHYAPGSISPWTNVWVLMAGALGLGASVSWLAIKTNSIRWSVIAHTLSGLIWGLR